MEHNPNPPQPPLSTCILIPNSNMKPT
uniref:Uncharacterized protein n=1 Tax=Anguilla anguilla TaxID=7936 RepID=A0A0E9TEF7_ANGAN